MSDRYPNYPAGFLPQNLENCRRKTECEGNCKLHAGRHVEGLQVVRVIDRNIGGYDWGYYAYCPNAIKEDRFRGFVVVLEGEEGFEP